MTPIVFRTPGSGIRIRRLFLLLMALYTGVALINLAIAGYATNRFLDRGFGGVGVALANVQLMLYPIVVLFVALTIQVARTRAGTAPDGMDDRPVRTLATLVRIGMWGLPALYLVVFLIGSIASLVDVRNDFLASLCLPIPSAVFAIALVGTLKSLTNQLLVALVPATVPNADSLGPQA